MRNELSQLKSWSEVFPVGEDFPRWSWHWGQQADNNMAHKYKYPEIIEPWGTSSCVHEDPTTTPPLRVHHLPNTGTVKYAHTKCSFLLFLCPSSTRQCDIMDLSEMYPSFIPVWTHLLTELAQPLACMKHSCMIQCSDLGVVCTVFPVSLCNSWLPIPSFSWIHRDVNMYLCTTIISASTEMLSFKCGDWRLHPTSASTMNTTC